MAEFLSPEDIDFAAYERETEAKQKVKSAAIYVHELIDRIQNPRRANHALMPWFKTHPCIQFRPGEVTVWGGANGNGKSLVTGQVALSLCAQDERVCIASFEMKPMKTLERMGRQWSNFNPADPAFSGSDEARGELVKVYQDFAEWTNKRLWLYDQQGTVNTTQVAAVVRYCAKELGVTHFFVDSLMKCVSGEDDFNGQKAFVDELTAIARDYSMHIHLVHHIRKPANEDYKPNKYDYSYPAHERDARSKGIPTLGSGRIFPVAEESIKVQAFPIPPHWARINGLDFGWDHPTAAVQLAWDRDNDCLYVVQTHRQKEATPLLHAATVKAWGPWVPTAWPHDGLQHDKGSGEQLALQYAKAGLLMLKDRSTFEDGSNGVEAGLMDMLERMQTGRLKVFSHLEDWFGEFRLYHRKDGKVVKLQDDLMSATRYALMMKRKAITRPVPQRQSGGGWAPLDREVGY